MDDRVARGLVVYVERVLQARFPGRWVLAAPVTVELVSAAELQRLGGEPVFGLYGARRILISRGVRRNDAIGLVAHEFAHAWQYQHHPDPERIEPELAEGFAEWTAYHVLDAIGYDQRAAAIGQNADLDYGGGFRRFRQLEDRCGVEAVFQAALTRTDF